MQTVFDWVTIAIFIATAGTFFYRTQREWPPLYKYLLVSVGCMVANQVGNIGQKQGNLSFEILALVMIGGLIGALIWLGTRPYNVRP
jgi:hypothetical protein